MFVCLFGVFVWGMGRVCVNREGYGSKPVLGVLRARFSMPLGSVACVRGRQCWEFRVEEGVVWEVRV